MSSNRNLRFVQKRCLHIGWLVMIFGVVLIAVGNTASLAQTTDGNGIFNPGFEKAGPLRWSAGSTAATIECSATLPHSGDASLRVADQSPDAVAFVASEPNRVLLQGGGRFYAEAWGRVDNAAAGRTGYGSASLDVVFYTADGKYLSSENVGTTSSAKWTRHSNVVTLPYEAALIGFRVTPVDNVPSLRGAVFVDDLYLAPLPVAERHDRVNLISAPQPPKSAPEYVAPPRPADGKFMAQTVNKLENGFDPPRPLVIWAIGSSFTDFLGNGEQLITAIRKRIPNAPPIVYKKMVGGSTPWHLTRGWARHLVAADQPDVVLVYNFGSTSGLEKLLIELRSRTTADILVGTLHWCRGHQPVWPDPEAATRHLDPPAVRELCARYQVELVESRREITRYMLDNSLEISDLLVDSVHQSPYAAHIINANIVRHFHRSNAAVDHLPPREPRIAANAEQVVRTGKWNSAERGAGIQATGPASLEIKFTGTGVDLIGWRKPGAGVARVWIDGKPADMAKAFCATYIQPDADNYIDLHSTDVDFRRHISDRCPHGISLGQNQRPQTWSIDMTSDAGDYLVTGSVTGADGKGNAFRPFTSTSGQIIIDPELWRLAKTNRSGDKFTFEVIRNVLPQVDFAGREQKVRFRLVHDLPHGKHTLKLEVEPGNEVSIEAFDVFRPLLKTS